MTSPVATATERLLATVDSLPDDEWGAPSVCAGWSRAHVIAHLALNAEGLAGAVRGVLGGEPVTMYLSDETRDADIEALSAEPPATVRERLQTGAADLAAALADLVRSPAPPGATFERTPGGIVMEAAAVPTLRLREVEIHHADLLAGYSWSDWPTETAVAFLGRDADRHDGVPFAAEATDVGRTFRFGDPDTGPHTGTPTVSGPVAALAWWATGRDPGDALSSTTGALPDLEGR